MGFYDTRCMLTGVSLHAIRATVVLLQQAGAAYRPIALGISGQYNRLGSIDGPAEDDHTDVVGAYFLDRMRDGRAVLLAGGTGTALRPEDIEGGPPPGPEAYWWEPAIVQLLDSVERNSLRFLFDNAISYATLDGVPLHAALIAEPVWDALAASRDGGAGVPVDTLFAETFADTAVPHEMYGRHTVQFAERIRRLHAIQTFVVEQGLAWAPPGEQAQRYPTDLGVQYDTDEFIDDARRDYAGHATLQAAFDRIERSLV